MHMADALLSPAVGGAMWAVSAATIACSSAAVRRDLDDRKVPLMGVVGAFIFAVQMINFSIPGTGSSGHLGGALLLAVLLGPSAAFLTIASVLVVQSLFFADGGLLALGCNIFNIGFLPAFVVYPFLYRKLMGSDPGRGRSTAVTLVSAVVALQLGAFAVVLETTCSGISALPFRTFVLLMQPIHLAIGVVEGMVTLAVVSFVRQARPELVQPQGEPSASHGLGKPSLAFFVCALLIAGVLSGFASKNPDGLEWAIARATGHQELAPSRQPVHAALAGIQEKTAVLPGYQMPAPAGAVVDKHRDPATEKSLGTGMAGIVGTLLTLVIAFLTGWLLKRRNQACCQPNN